MVGVALVVLVFGALVAAIWGRETAQGCFQVVGNLFWIALAVGLCIAMPLLGIGVALCYATYLLVKFTRAYTRSVELKQLEKQFAEQEANRRAQHTAAPQVNPAYPAERPSGALMTPQHCRPRPNAPTALPGAGDDAEYLATPVRDAERSGYEVEERQSGQRVFLSVSEYGRDWVPCRPPLKPKAQLSPTAPVPQWSPPRQRGSRP